MQIQNAMGFLYIHLCVCVRKLVEFVDKFDQILDHHFLNDTSTRTKIGTHLLN